MKIILLLCVIAVSCKSQVSIKNFRFAICKGMVVSAREEASKIENIMKKEGNL
jgi:hypothetical protein